MEGVGVLAVRRWDNARDIIIIVPVNDVRLTSCFVLERGSKLRGGLMIIQL